MGWNKLNAKLPIETVKLQATIKLPPTAKECLCFQINGKSSQAAKCIKSRIITKVINYILSVDTFEFFLLGLTVCYNHQVSNITIKNIGID